MVKGFRILSKAFSVAVEMILCFLAISVLNCLFIYMH